jgi:hypothetical protein
LSTTTPSRRTLQYGGIAAPAVGRNGPNSRSDDKDIQRTAAATATATTMATEEEECDGYDGTDPRCHLDDSLHILANRILLRSIAATTVVAAVAAESGDRNDIGALFIGREDREGNDGSGIATEDEDDTDTEAVGYASDFLEVILRQLWEGRFGKRRTTTKTTEMSGDNNHDEDIMTRSMSETLCEGKPLSSSSKALPKRRSPETTAARAGGVDPS